MCCRSKIHGHECAIPRPLLSLGAKDVNKHQLSTFHSLAHDETRKPTTMSVDESLRITDEAGQPIRLPKEATTPCLSGRYCEA